MFVDDGMKNMWDEVKGVAAVMKGKWRWKVILLHTGKRRKILTLKEIVEKYIVKRRKNVLQNQAIA